MSISPVTLPTELDRTFQEVMLQNNPPVLETEVRETVLQSGNPTVNTVTVQATTEGQPTETSVTTIQSEQDQVPVPIQTQIEQRVLEGENVAQIASETGLSVNEVDIELGIPTTPVSSPVVTAVGTLEPTATTNTPAAAIATYSDVLEVTTNGTTGQPQPATPGSTLSVDM